MMMSSHGDILFRFGRVAHPAAIGPGEQHGERRHMRVVVMTMMVAAMVMALVIMVMMMLMKVVAMVPAAMSTAVLLRLAFIQRKVLAHTDVEFAHV
ncbi:MAG TPA: hypothetical protein VH019_02380 [Rhizomicrobium sp.]|nr:hypothetical protein [Rhizomicrobium sp.]